MTDQQPLDASEPPPEPQPIGEPFGEQTQGEGAASSRGREWLAQLESMIQNVAREAAPVARDVGAKAAELAAVAAVKAGPLAHKAADATTEYGQKFAEKAQSVAAEWRHENELAKDAHNGNGAHEAPGGEAPETPWSSSPSDQPSDPV